MNEENTIRGEVTYKPKNVRFHHETDDPSNKYWKSSTKVSFDCHNSECKQVCSNENYDYLQRSDECNKCIKECEEKNIKRANEKRETVLTANREVQANLETPNSNINFYLDIQKIINFLEKHHYNDYKRKEKLVNDLTEFKIKNPDHQDVVEDIEELIKNLYIRYSTNKISKFLFSNRSRFFRRIDTFIDNLQNTLNNYEYYNTDKKFNEL